MAALERWIFSKEQLKNTPSQRAGISAETELNQRQQAAQFIQDMGQRLSVNQLCINTAIVYMHRFYMYQVFTDGTKSDRRFHRTAIAAAALFLAAKVEEQPRKLEHVIRVAYVLCNRNSQLDPSSDLYMEKAQELVTNENIILQTLGFDVQIEHPHKSVVKCCNLVKASKDLAQTSYFMATNSLHLTTFCLQYKPTVVACVCIHLACMWSNWEIPQSSEGKDWFYYVDKSVSKELLKELSEEFLNILQKTPLRLKKRLMSFRSAQGGNNKEEMARRASLEFASATNNTHLAPTIHHRGLDHPGESAPQAGATSKEAPPVAGPSTSSSSRQSMPSSLSSHDPTGKGDAAWAKKATAVRQPGNVSHPQPHHPHHHPGSRSHGESTTPQRKRPSEGGSLSHGGRGGPEGGEPLPKKIKPEVPTNSRTTDPQQLQQNQHLNPNPHSQSFHGGDPSSKKLSADFGPPLSLSSKAPHAPHAQPFAHASSAATHLSHVVGAGHHRHSSTRSGGAPTAAAANGTVGHPPLQQPHRSTTTPQQQLQQQQRTTPSTEGERAKGKGAGLTTPPCVVSLGSKVEETLVDTDTILSRGTLQMIQSPEFHHNQRKVTKHINPIVAKQRTLSGSEGGPPGVKQELKFDVETLSNEANASMDSKPVKVEKAEVKPERLDGIYSSKPTTDSPTTSKPVAPRPDAAAAAATTAVSLAPVKQEKPHKSEKTHKSDRTEKHHKHHKHKDKDKDKSHKRDRSDKHRESREASDSPKLKIKPVLPTEADPPDGFATSSPTSGLKLKVRFGGAPSVAGGSAGSTPPAPSLTKSGFVGAAATNHTGHAASPLSVKRESTAPTGNGTGVAKRESFGSQLKEWSDNVKSEAKHFVVGSAQDVKVKSEQHPPQNPPHNPPQHTAPSKSHHLNSRLSNGGTPDVPHSNGSYKRKSFPGHAHTAASAAAAAAASFTASSMQQRGPPPPYPGTSASVATAPPPHGRVSLPGSSTLPAVSAAAAAAAAGGPLSLTNWVQGQFSNKGLHHQLPHGGHGGHRGAPPLHNHTSYSHPPG